MWNKLFDLYCDIMTLDWLARRLGSMGRALGCYLFVAGLLWFYFGVLPEKPGHYYATMGHTGLRGTHETTDTAFYAGSLFTLGIAAIGFCLSLPLPRFGVSARRPRLRYRNPITFSRLTRQYRKTQDPWFSLPCRVGYRAFGDASLHPFDWYLTRQSIIHAPDREHICEFLLQCSYMSDKAQFGVADFWQHPSVLEKRKRGDCDDFALWAWRKLCESSVDAEFVVGHWRTPKATVAASPSNYTNHAWVIFRESDQTYVLETTCRNKEQMIRSLAEVRDEYVPHLSANRSSRIRVYGGYVGHLSDAKHSDALHPLPS